MNTGPGQGAHGPSSLPNWWPTDPRHTSPSTSDVMSQLCRVCGEPAAGFHFGAFTCEGCKSFFGRTYNNLSSISECKNNGECVINKKNRTSCKACRLRKCLVVGMSKSGSRYGRRSNWFKIHCLLQEQQQHHQNQMPHHHQHHQHVLQPPGGGGGLHFAAQRASRPSSLEPGRTPPSPQQPPLTLSQQQQPPAPLPMPWADVKHHLRLDADNNNSVVGDLNKDAGGRLSISAAAAAAAAVAQAVGRPELLRWPSPFFPAFPFPPPSPFFLALQQQQQQQQQQHHQHHQHHQPTPPPTRARRSTSASGSSSDDDDGPPSPKRSSYAVIRDAVMPPVQDAPMDLSVSAVAAAPPPDRPSRSPSPSDTDGGGRADGCARSPGDVSSSPTARTAAADETGRRRKRRRRRRRRKRREDTAGDGGGDGTSATADSGSDSDVSTADDGGGGGGGGSARPMKNVPLDLTCSRS